MNGTSKIKALALLLVMVVMTGLAPGNSSVTASAEYSPDFWVKDGELVSYRGSNAELEIPNGIIEISEGAFEDSEDLISVKIPASVEYIYPGVFAECDTLTGIYVDSANPYYKDDDGILFSKDGRTLWAFPANSPLTDCVIPDTVNDIAKAALFECANLTSITIPASVKDLGSEQFQYCPKLAAIYVDSANPYYKDDDGVLFSKNGQALIVFPPDSAVTEYAMPDTVTYVSERAFYGCENLASISISASLTNIYERTFSRCTSLTSVDIPNSVTSIDNRAFWGCDRLTSVTILNSATRIASNAFPNNDGFTIYAPAGSYAEQYAKKNELAFSSTSSNASSLTPEVPAGNDSAVGSYALAAMSMSGITMNAEQMAAFGQDISGFSLEISADGKFSLSASGMTGEGTWENNGNDYMLTVGTETLYGQYNASDMTFSLEMQDAKMNKAVIVFSQK